MAPKTLDRYQLIDVLGTGAFATVWRATDPVLNKDVAIKILADNWARDPEIRERFLSEARLALEATSPHLVRVYHVVDNDDQDPPYIVMELADSGTLEDRIRQRRLHPYSIHEALTLLTDITRTVGALHENGLIHRDLKPGNVLFQTRNGTERPLLGDFGLARLTDRSALTMVAGTPAYTAPEQAAGLTQLGEQADLYSLGVIFLEMIGGQTPEHRTMAEAANGLDLDHYLTEHHISLDPQVKAFVRQLLDPKPENRPANADELINQITALLANVHHDAHATIAEPPLSLDPTPTPAPATPAPVAASLVDANDTNRQLSPALIAIPILLLLVGAFVAVNALTSNTDTEPAASDVAQTTDPADTTAPDLSTTTLAAGEAETVTTTATAPSTTTAPVEAAPDAEIPEDFPVPTSALSELSLSNGNKLQTYTLSGIPSEVEDFYATVDWDITNRTEADGTIALTITQGASTVNASIEPFTNSTGVALVRLVITPVS